MPKQEDVVEVDKTQQDIIELKSNYSLLKKDVEELQRNDVRQDGKIEAVQATLSSIQDDTKWIRRMITKTIVTAVITGLIGGVITLFFASFS